MKTAPSTIEMKQLLPLRRTRKLVVNSRLLLLTGFGGLLLLMAFAEFDGVRAQREERGHPVADPPVAIVELHDRRDFMTG